MFAQFGQIALGSGNRNHVCSGIGQTFGTSAAYTAPGACNERDLPFKSL